MIEVFTELGNHGRPGLEMLSVELCALKTDRLKS